MTDTITIENVIFESEKGVLVSRDVFDDDTVKKSFHIKKNKDSVHELESFSNFKDAKETFFDEKEVLSKEEAFDKIKEAAEFVEECGFDGKEMSRAISDILEVVRSVED